MKTATRFRVASFFAGLPFWIPVLILTPVLFAQEEPGASSTPEVVSVRVRRDSMFALGERQVLAGEFEKAVATYSRIVEIFPEDAVPLTRLGDVYLKKADFKAAERAFKAAKELDGTRPEAYVGLGMVYVERPAMGLGAFYNFRRALGEAKRATRIDSTYAPAYRLLGQAYERFREGHEKAIEYYMKYLELEREDADGLYHFGLSCVQARQYDKIDTYIAPFLEEHPREIRLVPLAAQAYFFLERYELALIYFERYLQNLEDRERGLYTDVSLVASRKELDAYRAISEPSERIAYLERFWKRRDPDILTRVNERIVEHYRRVWYARTFFAERFYPWDRRGEVYIRYGEPDYRSRSSQKRVVGSPQVEALRTRIAVSLYGPAAAFLTFTGPVFPIRATRNPSALANSDPDEAVGDPSQSSTETEGSEAAPLQADEEPALTPFDVGAFENQEAPRFDEAGILNIDASFDGYAPVTVQNDLSTVSWEAWAYTHVQNGIEIVFTDETHNGRYDFAPVPPVVPGKNQLRLTARLVDHAPEVVYQNAVEETPDYYRPGIQGPGLEFYFDQAAFRGDSGRTVLEIYYGIPPEQIEIAQQADSALIHVQCAVALADEDHTNIYRTAETFLYRDVDDFSRAKGAFLPELLKIEVPPGEYELQIQLRDRVSGRAGVYRKRTKVTEFTTDTFQFSDILLASAIGDTTLGERFRKDDVWVVPMPSRTYVEAQKVYAYYEIYNLEADAFGQTRYRVHYRVRSSSEPDVGLLNVVNTRLGSLFKRKKPQVSITYEQVGKGPTEQEYFEIDLGNAGPGLKVLEITIEDLVGGQSQTREIRFRYGS